MGKITHGLRHTRTYAIWCGIITRVTNSNRKTAKYYIGKGITVCESWRKFENFYADMGIAPEGMWIERRDNNGNYCKDNCFWETPSRQCSNRGRITNKSGRLGVYLDASVNKWRAIIKVDKLRVDCGRFLLFENACEAIEKAEIKHLGYSRKEGFI